VASSKGKQLSLGGIRGNGQVALRRRRSCVARRRAEDDEHFAEQAHDFLELGALVVHFVVKDHGGDGALEAGEVAQADELAQGADQVLRFEAQLGQGADLLAAFELFIHAVEPGAVVAGVTRLYFGAH
jgi:hypothetical protein